MKAKSVNSFKRGLRAARITVQMGFSLVLLQACDFLDVGPPKTQLVQQTVFESDASAEAAVIGIYSHMMDEQGLASILATTCGGMSSDEFDNYSVNPNDDQLVTNNISPANSLVLILWRNAYLYIYHANAVLEGLQNSTRVSPAVKTQLEGEARFIRAFSYYYLVNLFGDVPQITSTLYHDNAVAPRTQQADIYNLIVDDLRQAQQQLSPDYRTGEKVRPNRATATALLARVFLYTSQWEEAATAATEVIESGTYALEADLGTVFLANSAEAIWQLCPVSPGYNTYEAASFVTTTEPKSQALREDLLNIFEADDNRQSAWIGQATDGITTYHFPYKYKVIRGEPEGQEYYTVLRLAELYLIRAEARAMRNNATGAWEDVDAIRERAGAPLLAGTNPDATTDEILQAIMQERRRELMAEWGHRWFDLKRTGKATSVLGPLKSDWQETDVRYPIPQSERSRNPNLSQNDGY